MMAVMLRLTSMSLIVRNSFNFTILVQISADILSVDLPDSIWIVSGEHWTQHRTSNLWKENLGLAQQAEFDLFYHDPRITSDRLSSSSAYDAACTKLEGVKHISYGCTSLRTSQPRYSTNCKCNE
jgi:hypothetical protein